MIDFRKEYILLIAYAKKRNLEYKSGMSLERHHILPKCIFPQWKKKKSNIVVLTREEHIKAHFLLKEIYKNEKLEFAYMSMTREINSSKLMSILWKNNDYRLKVTESNKKTWSDPKKLKEHSDLMKEIFNRPEIAKKRKEATRKVVAQKVRNIETGLIFDSMVEAAKWAGISASPKIGECCRHKRKCAGKTPDGKPATWEYVGFSERTKRHPVKILEKVPIFNGAKNKKTKICVWTNGKENIKSEFPPDESWWRGLTRKQYK